MGVHSPSPPSCLLCPVFFSLSFQFAFHFSFRDGNIAMPSFFLLARAEISDLISEQFNIDL